jgi:cation diffusion facilitator family transporter
MGKMSLLEEPLVSTGHNRHIRGLTEVFSPSQRVGQPSTLNLTPSTRQRHERLDQRALKISVVFNIAIVAVKLVATIVSGSLAVTATLVDSVLDVLSQFILFYTDSASKNHDSNAFPAGRTRLAPLGIFICAVLMGMASIEVVHESVVKLNSLYWNESYSLSLSMSPLVLGAMLFSFLCKAALYFLCVKVGKTTGNDSVKAVALDHLNDLLSIVSATAAAVASFYSHSLLWVDPVSAILISIYIMSEWWSTAKEQANMLVGRTADDDFLKEVRKMGNAHHPQLTVDIIRAYHFGPKYLVELEVVLPPTMTLEMTHDIGMELQHKIEAFEQVERAFVHIDYQVRDYDEHNEQSWPQAYAERVRESIRPQLTDA